MSTTNERNSTQTNTSGPTNNIQYGYPTNCFDFVNLSPMQNPHDVYSYYSPNPYPSFNSFDEQNPWSSNDTSGPVPPQTGPLQYHPSMYTPTGIDIPRSPFEYGPLPGFSHYHPAFTPSSGASMIDMSWHPHNLSMQQQMQVAAQRQAPSTGDGFVSNKKTSIYDEYQSAHTGVSDMLSHKMNSIDLGNNNRRNFDKTANSSTENMNFLSSKSQQRSQSNISNNISLARPTQLSSGPKSYASVVSSDRMPQSLSNMNTHSMNEHSLNTFSDSQHLLNNNNTLTGYNPRHSQQQSFSNWSNNKSDQTSSNNTRHQNSSTYVSNGNQQEFDNHQYNPKDFNLNPKGARFFVIKSYSEDDVHRSIKYNIWCSTEHGNKRLDAAFREREGKGPVYLFFSVNASGHFCGMAEMMSPVDYEHQTNVWHMSNKWQGKFEVKWIYVKDVPNQQFRNIRLENNDNKPVTNSRDTQEIPYEKGKLMLKTLHMYKHKTSLFDDFQYYDSKQEKETSTKPTTLNDFQPSNRRQITANRIASTMNKLDQNQDDDDNENN